MSGRPLEQAELQPIIDKLLDRLVSKNVAENIGQQVCESVCASLLGKQVSSFATLSNTVKASMEGALTRILTPTRRVDLLADVQRAREEKRPHVIVFVGVNGVGKSTSLSKVAYYLKSNGFVPMLCACDTFRAAARRNHPPQPLLPSPLLCSPGLSSPCLSSPVAAPWWRLGRA